MRIAISGPPSAGKTTLAKALAAHLNITYIDECARLFVEYLGKPTVQDQYFILLRQIEKENQHTSFVTDSPTFLCGIYAALACNPTDARQNFYLSQIIGHKHNFYDTVINIDYYDENLINIDPVRNIWAKDIDVIKELSAKFSTTYPTRGINFAHRPTVQEVLNEMQNMQG